MKHCHFSHFLYRAFHSPGFRLSTGLGLVVAVCQIVQMFSPVDTGFSYPSSLYEMWLGGEWASYASALVFLLLPLFATLPFSSSLAEDKKSGYLIQLLIRGKRLSPFSPYCGNQGRAVSAGGLVCFDERIRLVCLWPVQRRFRMARP